MAHEEDLLACLLDIAEAELNSLNRDENADNIQRKDVSTTSHSKDVRLHEIDLFSCEGNEEELETVRTNSNIKGHSSVHDSYIDSSDDEAQRNLEPSKYFESGKSIKKLLDHAMPSSKSRIQTEVPPSKITPSRNWNSKGIPQLQTANKKLPEKTRDLSNVSSFDTLLGIRVINPIISSKNLEEKMIGRKVIPIQHISNHLKLLGKNEDWVVAGVICSKGTPKTSAKGHQFMIWTMSDLKGDIKTIALFLFGSAYEQFWKTQPGCVVGVLNPSILDKRDGARDEASLSVDNAQKLLILGQSKDFGMCKSTKKNGDKCTAIVNKGECEYCVYHVRKEYQRSSRRSELQANFSGKGLIALRNKVLGKNEVFYAGKSYTSIPAKQSRKLIKKDKDRLQSLNGVTTNSSVKKTTVKKAAVTFDVGRAQRMKDLDTLRKLKGNSDNLDADIQISGKNHSNEVTLSEAKANAVKILSKLHTKSVDKVVEEKITEKESQKSSDQRNDRLGLNKSKIERKGNKSSEVDHNYELLQKSLDEIVQTDFVDLNVDYKKNKDIQSHLVNDFDYNRAHNHKRTNNEDKESQNKTINPTPSSSSTEKNLITNLPELERKRSSDVLRNDTNLHKPSQPTSELVFSKALLAGSSPSLSNNGAMIDLAIPLPKKVHKAKFNALKFIEKNGPLEKSDPNSVRGKGLKRSFNDLNFNENSTKMQKIENNENFSDRFKKMMEIQSKHMDLVEMRDNEEKEKYFRKQEVKEKMEEKMANTYKVECKAVKCLDCKYTNFSAGDKCKAEKHRLVYKNAFKRFFKCGNCGNRVACLDVIPLHACKSCGDGRWERTTMMKEKLFTNTVSLSIRGGEQKFTNSVVTDANINLLVPDES